MIEKIGTQITVIEKSNRWINNRLEGDRKETTYRSMVNFRRELNKKRLALSSNPAAAIYGESQVGKSYLVSSLLSEKESPFGITDQDGVKHLFVENINPLGGGSESTSLVSRFSTNFKCANPEFPIKAILLTPADILLVLCDSFYKDIKYEHGQLLSIENINEHIATLYEEYKDKPNQQVELVEDHILEIEEYFKTHLPKADRILSSRFFDSVFLFIRKVEPKQWKNIFSILWNKNEVYTNLFDTLIAKLSELGFSNEVYLPVKSVLNRYGTLLAVDRLKELNRTEEKIEKEYQPSTPLLLSDGKKEREFPKSYLCALSAELIFGQPKELENSKPFLKQTDLLDFPGARGRMEIPATEIKLENIPDLLIRGKVAYLFNKYSEAERINILLFCAKHVMSSQRAMPAILNEWITKIVGKNQEEREQFLKTSKISPLFIIETFFNANLAYDNQQDKANDETSLKNRWLQRFDKSLEELIEIKNYKWLEKWTVTKPDFQNIYLLRDFEKSETPSNLFKGYNKHKKELEEVFPENFPNFKEVLRQSFLDYPFVKRHFENPALSWDEAASINKDGTDLIIKNLTTAAEHINRAREEKILGDLKRISKEILDKLMRFFHSSDKDEQLNKAKSIVGDIQFDLDRAFSADGIGKYGKLMKEMMVTEGEILSFTRDYLNSVENNNGTITNDPYDIYRVQVPPKEGDTVATYRERLYKHYSKETEEDKRQFREKLHREGVDLEELLSGNKNFVKNNAQQLAEAIMNYWLEKVKAPDKLLIQDLFNSNSSSYLEEIAEMFEKLFLKLKLSEKIAARVKRFLVNQGKASIPYEIIADMSAESLNRCINSVGYDYWDESDIKALKEANEKNNLGLVLTESSIKKENSPAELFTKIDNLAEILIEDPGQVRSLPNYRNYFRWYDQLKIGFISVCDIPNYDVGANQELGEIIEECKLIKY